MGKKYEEVETWPERKWLWVYFYYYLHCLSWSKEKGERKKPLWLLPLETFFLLRSILCPFLQSFAYFLVPLGSPLSCLKTPSELKTFWKLSIEYFSFLNLNFDYTTSELKKRDQEKMKKTVRNLIAGVQTDWFPF